MARYYLIGGHDYNIKSNYIYERMLSLVKKNPRILLFPTATCDDSSQLDKFKDLVGTNSTIDSCLLYNYPDITDVISRIKDYDILFINGGNTIKLKEFLTTTGYDKIFYEASKGDILIAGVSAGAMILSSAGLADAYSYSDNFSYYNYKRVEGLNILDIGFCPHFDKNDRILYYRDTIEEKIAYALSDDTAIYINNNEIKFFKAKPNLEIFKFRKENNFMMEQIELPYLSVLGPKGTFSELAAIKLMESTNTQYQVKLFNNIRDTFKSISSTGLGLIPFENTLDGYVAEVLDLLHKHSFNIIGEINIPVSFSFISKAKDIKAVKKVYSQFKAKGQCLDFLNDNGFEIIETESNSRSYDLVKNSGETYGAIVPNHVIERGFSINIANVQDNIENYTRFLLISKESESYSGKKASIVLDALKDRPGILMEALTCIKKYNVNINSIMSRPTKTSLGSYYFYFEIESIDSFLIVDKLIEEINNNKMFKARCLGIYKNLEEKKNEND